MADGLQRYISVAANPENMLGGTIAPSNAHQNKPGHVTFEITFSVFCKCSEHILSYAVLKGLKILLIYDNILILNDIYQSGIAAVLGQG